MEKQLIQIGDALRTLRVSRSTLLRWEQRGIVKPFKNHTRWRYYTPEQIVKLQKHIEPQQEKSRLSRSAS